MRFIKYLLQFIFIGLIFIIFRIIGLKLSRSFGSKIFLLLGPFFRSKKIIEKNLLYAFSEKDELSRKVIISNMWKSYGKIFAEYLFIKYFRKDKTNNYIEVKGQEILDKIKTSNEPVIFISGHFDNFELMAMHIEKSGIDLAAIYRPLNNYFLNPFNVCANLARCPILPGFFAAFAICGAFSNTSFQGMIFRTVIHPNAITLTQI